MDNVIYIAAVFVLAGAVKGVTGMGLPTVGVGLLSLVMRLVEAAALLVVPSVLTNAWQLLSGVPVLPLLRRQWPMMAGICTGTLLAGMAGMAAQDAWRPAMAGMSFLAQLPALAGMPIGQHLRGRMPPALFHRCFLLALMVPGMHLALQWAWH